MKMLKGILLFAADVSGVRRLAAKSNEKLVNHKYATLFLSWIPFSAYLKETERKRQGGKRNIY